MFSKASIGCSDLEAPSEPLTLFVTSVLSIIAKNHFRDVGGVKLLERYLDWDLACL